jgi:hypothetical protein
VWPGTLETLNPVTDGNKQHHVYLKVQLISFESFQGCWDCETRCPHHVAQTGIYFQGKEHQNATFSELATHHTRRLSIKSGRAYNDLEHAIIIPMSIFHR